jgi:UDP-galactopyranose mutase
MISPPDLVCLSHLRWGFVYQRPQHLLSRFARDRRTFFIEEPRVDAALRAARLDVSVDEASGVVLVQPQLPEGLSPAAAIAIQAMLLDDLFEAQRIRRPVLWYYTPMALPFTRHLDACVRVFDCMDELSAFKNAPAGLRELEAEMFSSVDLVFTGGHSLYRAKRHLHPNVHAVPSSVDRAHFALARLLEEPADQAVLPGPRAGFFGVIDERMDLDLLAGLADLRPELQIVMVGPVAKIDPASLPRRPNLHWLGGRTYDELPGYLAGWDVALVPFARNESTRFVSPTKTPEYLAAGRPVVSTSIQDVVEPYERLGLVHIADDPEAFARAVDAALAEDADRRNARADAFLAGTSWDKTFARMLRLLDGQIALERRRRATPLAAEAVLK